jgi:hypothetical protein
MAKQISSVAEILEANGNNKLGIIHDLVDYVIQQNIFFNKFHAKYKNGFSSDIYVIEKKLSIPVLEYAHFIENKNTDKITALIINDILCSDADESHFSFQKYNSDNEETQLYRELKLIIGPNHVIPNPSVIITKGINYELMNINNVINNCFIRN